MYIVIDLKIDYLVILVILHIYVSVVSVFVIFDKYVLCVEKFFFQVCWLYLINIFDVLIFFNKCVGYIC
jgi:hypothetical protein